MQEYLLYQYWLAISHQQVPLQVGNHRLRVFDAGELNLHQGPDFRGAFFELDGVCYRGDVECHMQKQDWYRHHHHLDARYGNVVLHITAGSEAGLQEPVHNWLGASIPTLTLKPSQEEISVHFCGHCKGRVEAHLIQHLALRRLHMKVSYLHHRLSEEHPEQLFYEQFFRVLGYPRNAHNFERLARLISVDCLRILLSQYWVGEELLLVLYLKTAGLLKGSEMVTRKFWELAAELGHLLPHEMMDREEWYFGGVRPCNHPYLRIAGWVKLLCRHRSMPFRALLQIIQMRLPMPELWRKLKQFFALPTNTWLKAEGCNSFVSSHRHRFRFLGEARLAELLINVLIPFALLEAAHEASSGYAAYLEDIYFTIPHVCTYRKYESFFPFLRELRRRWPAQSLYQGLIQLEREYCRYKNCSDCPIEQKVKSIKTCKRAI